MPRRANGGYLQFLSDQAIERRPADLIAPLSSNVDESVTRITNPIISISAPVPAPPCYVLRVMESFLILEAEQALRERLSHYFGAQGFSIDIATDAASAQQRLDAHVFDVVILDMKTLESPVEGLRAGGQGQQRQRGHHRHVRARENRRRDPRHPGRGHRLHPEADQPRGAGDQGRQGHRAETPEPRGPGAARRAEPHLPHEELHRQEPRHPQGPRPGGQGGAEQLERDPARGDGDGEGAARRGAALQQPAGEERLRAGQLRDASGHAAGERAVRPREGRLHGGGEAADRDGSSRPTAGRSSSTRSPT